MKLFKILEKVPTTPVSSVSIHTYHWPEWGRYCRELTVLQWESWIQSLPQSFLSSVQLYLLRYDDKSSVNTPPTHTHARTHMHAHVLFINQRWAHGRKMEKHLPGIRWHPWFPPASVLQEVWMREGTLQSLGVQSRTITLRDANIYIYMSQYW